MKRIAFPIALLLATVALAGCGAKGGGDASAAAPAAPSSPSGGVEAVSKYDAGPRAAESAIDESKAEQGKSLFQTKGCSACHAFGRRLSCPDLMGVSHRRTTAWMENQILHPDVMTRTDPISHQLFAQYALQMPNQGLTPDEAAAVIEFLKHNDHEAGETESK